MTGALMQPQVAAVAAVRESQPTRPRRNVGTVRPQVSFRPRASLSAGT
jgi:hypothetical protein